MDVYLLILEFFLCLFILFGFGMWIGNIFNLDKFYENQQNKKKPGNIIKSAIK